jgi:hypothetical protein
MHDPPTEPLPALRGQRNARYWPTEKADALPLRLRARTESHEAQDLAHWLRSRTGLVFLHVPNEGVRTAQAAAKARREGLAKGAPDYLVFTPAPAAPRGAAVELKRAHAPGARARGATPHQRLWLQQLETLGWRVKVAYGARDAIAWLTKLGY